ncbi:MAG: dienelactone hydrolase family protein [Pigmentiphaga sp.]
MNFAPAAGQPTDNTIHTPADGLRSGDIAIATSGESLPAYYAAPAQGIDLPVVLVVQEIFGVHEHIKDICRRLAHEGYLAVAPELYFRQGDASRYDDIPTLFAELVSKVPDAQVLADLDAAAAWARSQGGSASQLAITGFCWGGRITWLYAAHQPAIKAAVAWYGRLAGDTDPLHPQHPTDIAGTVQAPVLGLYGGQDTGIPLEAVDAMRAALAQGGAAAKQSEIHVYPDAPHAFYADYRPSYRADDAADGWRRMLAWFGQRLG